jgi:MFS family permease
MLGAVAGSFLAGVLSTSYGRLTLLTGSQAVAAVFSVLSAFSQNIWQFLVLRAVLAASMEVSTSMAQVYAVSEGGDDFNSFASVISKEDENGDRPISFASAMSLLVFFVYALLCLSTVAVVKRETNGW